MAIWNDVVVTCVVIVLTQITWSCIKILRRNLNKNSANPKILKSIDVSFVH